MLVRKETEAAKIAQLVAEDPAQLVVEGLQAYPNNATTAIDLEITLAQVIGEEKFKKWWSGAKKAVAKKAAAKAGVVRRKAAVAKTKKP